MLLNSSRQTRSNTSLSHPDMATLSRAFEDPDDAARDAHVIIGDQRDREYGGFILRRDDGRYVATKPRVGEDFSFNPALVFPFDEEAGTYRLPVGHHDYAMYHSHPSVPFEKSHWWPQREQATHFNFFSTSDLHTAISQHDFAPVSYLSGPDGSLIKYTSSASLAEGALLSRLVGEPNSPDLAALNELDRAMIEGTLVPSDIVRLVAAAGDLQVVVASRLWGKVGKVAADWKPYPRRNDPGLCESVYPPMQPVLSPVFRGADDAGRYVHQRMGSPSREAIIGVVLKNPDTGEYRAVEPMVNGEAVDSRCTLLHPEAYYRPVLPGGYRIDGLYFVAATPPDEFDGPGQELRQQFFPPADLHRLFEYRHVPSKRPQNLAVRYGFTVSEVYFCAPDGALLSYSPSHSPAEYALARQVSRAYSGSESTQNRLDAGRMSIGDFIGLVAAAGRLRVLVPSDNWPQVGVV